MNAKKFSEAMSEIHSRYVDEAISYKAEKKKGWIKWGAMAACLALVVYAGVEMLSQEQPETELPDLPMLAITDDRSEDMAYGYEGYMAFDISELVNANPWNENMELSTMPVYKNSLTYDTNYIASGADFDKMREFILEIARRCGFDTNTLTITDDVPDEETKQKIIEKLQMVGETIPDGYFDPTELIIRADGLKIEVNQAMTATISFNPTVSLPDEYNFTHYASYADYVAVAEYLKEEYKNLIGMEDPQVNIYGGGYNIYAQQGYHIEFFDASGNDTEQIINYNFNRVAFYCDGEGKLYLARIYQPDLSGKVGDYPIITSGEARELLSSGNYITSVPYEMPGLEYVRKVELVYRTGEREEYYMPYYRFYVELPEEEREHGLKDYGAYYVPAVNGALLSNMPTWDGSFIY